MDIDFGQLYFDILSIESDPNYVYKINKRGIIFVRYNYEILETFIKKGDVITTRDFKTLSEIAYLTNVEEIDTSRFNIKFDKNGFIYFKTEEEAIQFDKYIKSLMVINKMCKI